MLSIIAPLRDMFIKRTEQNKDGTQTVTDIMTFGIWITYEIEVQ